MTEAQAEPMEAAAVFSPEAFEHSLQYTKTAQIDTIRQDLDVLQHIDEVNEKKERFWTRLRTTSIVLIFLSVFVAFVMAESFGWIVVVLLGCITAAILCHRKTVSHARLNLDNRRYGVIDELLGFLAYDMASDAVVEVSIDFHKYDADERYHEAPASSKKTSNTAESYSVPWLAMKGRFVDNSRFRLSVTQKVKRKERSKRKYTKVKEAFREKIVLSLFPDLSTYPALNQAQTLLSQGKYGFGYYEQHQCFAPWLHAFVSHTGEVFACCMTREKMPSLGNVLHQSLADIFQGTAYQQFRHQMTRERLAICANCDQYLPENRLVESRLAQAQHPLSTLTREEAA